jgi:hypothetical protein
MMGISSLTFGFLYIFFAVIPGIMDERKKANKMNRDYEYLNQTVQPTELP